MNLSDVKQYIQKFQKKLQDIVAVDFASTGIYCVRLKKSNDEVLALATAILPPDSLDFDLTQDSEKKNTLQLPKNLVARAVSIAIPGDDSVVKLLNMPSQFDESNASELKKHLGIEQGEGGEQPDYRIGYCLLSREHSQAETRLVAVAVTEAQLHAARARFGVGLPVPLSIELSGLAVLSAFMQGPAREYRSEAVGLVELGENVSYLAFFNKNELILLRKFSFGTRDLLEKIQKRFNVDQAMARNIITDESLDISHLIKESSESFLKQLVISKHFVERHANCQISKLFAPSGIGVSRSWLNEVKTTLTLDVASWNPFDCVKLLPEAYSAEHEGQQYRFAAAIGAGLASLEIATT